MRAPVLARRVEAVADPVVDLLHELLAGQRALDAKLDALLARLTPGPRDGGDIALVRVIAAVSGGLPITAAALWRRRAAGDEALTAALLSCDIENPKQLGKLLKRLEAREVAGVCLQRIGVNREGAVWRARVQE